MQITPKVSIIVPVYNVEQYLEKCIKSIINQTLRDIEIILVNDGSQDKSGEICELYKVKDNRVRVYHKDNAGVSSARELGVINASGEFVFFVDSDDWLEHDALSIIHNKAVEENADLVSIGYFKDFQHKRIVAKPLGYDCVYKGCDVKETFLKRLVGPTDTALANPHKFDAFSSMKKLYKRSLIIDNNLIFIDSKKIVPGEDLHFNIQFAYHASIIVHIESPLYHYRKEVEGSATGGYKANYFEKYKIRYDEYEKLIKQFGLDNSYLEALNNRICCELISLMLKESNPSNKKNILKKLSYIREHLNSRYYKTKLVNFDISKMPFKWKLFFSCCRLGFSEAVYFMALVMRNLRPKVS